MDRANDYLRYVLARAEEAGLLAFEAWQLAAAAGAILSLLLAARLVRRRSGRRIAAPPAPAVAEAQEEGARPATIHTGLQKTRKHFFSRLGDLLGGRASIDKDTYSSLEELLITSDLGVRTSEKLLSQIEAKVAEEGELSQDSLRTLLRESIRSILETAGDPKILPARRDNNPLIVMVVGVNGVGKTTTIGKLAAQFKNEGAKVLIAACDTFRAAAVEQMQAWGRRVGVEVEAGPPSAKPATVAFQAVHRARNEGFDVLIVDTAGRLHTRVNLMNELVNVVRIIEREQPGSPHETLLVLDASTGQNALQQAREFHERVSLTGIVVTKLDGTPKGGIVVAIKDELGIPIRYIGVGEGVDDLRVFSASEFVDALFAEDTSGFEPSSDAASPARKVQRRRGRERAFS